MNWIIRKTTKLRCHTNLTNLLTSDWININDYTWFLADLDVVNYADYNGVILPIDFRKKFHLPSIENFLTIVNSDLQIIWGIISATEENQTPKFDNIELPTVEGNNLIWENDYFQVKNAVLEITAWDSSYTIVKFRDENLSKKFQEYFPEAILLEKFKF